MNRRLIVVLAAALLVLVSVVPTTAAPRTSVGDRAFTKAGVYIVQLAEWPVVAYDGSVRGYPATRPAPGTKVNPNSNRVSRYVDYLTGRHDAMLKQVGASAKLYSYTYSYNGFAARLSAKQANAIAASDGVVAVTRDKRWKVDTSSTPSFLGLDAEGGLWDQLGGVDSAGEGVVIGIVDSGIWPDSLSFADRVDASGAPSSAPSAKRAFKQVPGWHGKCTPGESFNASDCNQKLIGAQYFNAAWGGNAGVESERPWEFMSPRDYNGHGTHTASTSGGNHGVPTTGPGAAFGSISGMAPRARIAAYKALWSTEDGSTASGFTSDLAAAIDAAVHDGVDVINYSVSGTQANFGDPVQISFLFAAAAGIFVSASAGNSGPGASTVAHPSPWLTTVAAGTHNRAGSGSVTLGNAAVYTGASVAATAVGPVQIVDSADVVLAGENAGQGELCYPGTLDPAEVSGKIVLCKRGAIARTDKSLAVQMAGGVGMVLYDSPDLSLNADFHFVPSVHVNQASGLAIKAYIVAEGASATATINQATISYDADAPFTAAFSSRGPSLAAGGDLLKPDVIAPGVDILAAVAPPANHGLDFNQYSGTSMSAPHVAGLAALFKDLHPSWSPMAIKSALMTTGTDVEDAVSTTSKIFRQGAGHVAPNSAVDPGLVFNAGWLDWLAFLCGSSSLVGPGTCSALAGLGYSFDPSDYNQASIAIGSLAGVQTVTRKVTNVGGSTATYDASVSGLTGIDVDVSPDSLTLDPGETGSFTVTFTTDGAALNAYAGGHITWSHGPHAVRMPVVIRPVPLAAPAVVTETATADDDSFTWGVTSGYAGDLSANAYGVVLDDVKVGEVVAQDPDQEIGTDTFTVGVNFYDFTIGPDVQYWAGGTMEATTETGSDLDVFLLRADANGDPGFQFPGDLVAFSADGDSEEIVQLVNPTDGDYRLIVHGWGTPDGASTYDLHRWTVGGTADGGSLVARAKTGDPATVAVAETVPITAEYTGLTDTGQYRGIVVYVDGAATVVGRTVVIINR